MLYLQGCFTSETGICSLKNTVMWRREVCLCLLLVPCWLLAWLSLRTYKMEAHPFHISVNLYQTTRSHLLAVYFLLVARMPYSSNKKLRGLSPQANYTTERPPLVREVSANIFGKRVSRGQRNGSPRPYSRFSRQEPLLSIQVSPQLYSRGWVDSVPDPQLLRKSVSAWNRTRDIWICSQELWPLDHRRGITLNLP
jgi:hypothetical protein